MTIVARRTRSPRSGPSGLSSSAEAAALALGMRTALNSFLPEDRRMVILATDCEGTINLLTGGGPGGGRSSNFGGGQKRMGPQERSYLWAAAALVRDADESARGEGDIDGVSGVVAICKVRSVSRTGRDGFFDHSVADMMSASARGSSNGAIGLSLQKSINSAPKLRNVDLEWLGESEGRASSEASRLNNDSVGGRGPPKLKPRGPMGVNEREDGRMRRKRCQDRIRAEFGLDLPS